MQKYASPQRKFVASIPASNPPVGLLVSFFLTGAAVVATAAMAATKAKPRPTAPQPKAKPMTSLVLSAKSRTSIVLPTGATAAEKNAAEELQHYLQRITGGSFTIQNESAATDSKAQAIYIGNTAVARRAGIKPQAFKPEEWLIRSQGNALILQGGGPRGALYAAYHLLEDEAGVRWWNPWEETVPGGKTLSWGKLNRKGKPVFGYRDIYSHYGPESNQFFAHMRLNGRGGNAMEAKFGGSRYYGPPDHSHTTYLYLPPDKYFAAHPEWYKVPGGGEPTYRNSQLAYSNPEMRQEFLKIFRENIRKSRQEAAAKGDPLPEIFDVSQEDNRIGFVSSPADEELVKKEGSEAAILLDFLNFLADGIKDEFPDVYIDTLAYFSGEKAPKSMKPRDNIVIRLTDTTSNVLLPITAERNKFLRQNVEDWSKLTKNLRIWDYAVTFDYPGLPEPTSQTYEKDFRFWADHGVDGVFTEFEFVILADMRDLKFWIYSKFLEDPRQDYKTLLKTFTDGFYGPAGPMVREYLAALEKQGVNGDIDWFSGPGKHSYLTFDFARRGNAILERAAKAVENNPVLSRRVRHARMPLDRAIAVLFPTMMKQWLISGGQPTAIPLDRNAAAARYLQSWNEQIDMRLLPEKREEERIKANAESKGLSSGPLYTPPPARFKDVPVANLFDYGPNAMRLFRSIPTIEGDKSLESGLTARLPVEDGDLARYKLPMPWGTYDTVTDKYLLQGTITEAEVTGPGYHWFKLGPTKLTPNAQLYLFWSWHIQVDFDNAYDPANPDAEYDVWANIKFEGPGFPHGKAEDKNSISVERVVLVKR